MILMGSNPDQEEEEEDPPAPSNSQSGPLIREEDENYRRNKPSETSTALFSGLKQEPGSRRTRSSCVAASIGPKNPLRCRISSVHHRPPRCYSYIRVFHRERRSVRLLGAQQPAGGDPARRAEARRLFTGDQAARAGRVGAGCRCSVLGGWIPGRAAPDVRGICRQRCCCNLTAPPPVTASANHSQAGDTSRAPIGPPACRSPRPVSNLNTEIT